MIPSPFPVVHGKLIILLKDAPQGEDWRVWYLERHIKQVTALPAVTDYVANILCKEQFPHLTRACNGEDPYGVRAVDEIKGAAWDDIQGLYAGVEILGAYQVTEYLVRELHTDRPPGIKSPELKRIALLTRPLHKSHEEAMRYWIERHPAFCFRHHTGMASYSQNHVDAKLTANSPDVDGFPILTYWNEDAFRYGHFSMKDTQRLMMEDCRHFRSTSFTVSVDEYIMKRAGTRTF